jgi:hypothetical protein
MAKNRGSSHTTLTQTAQTVVEVLKRIPGVKMIAPGIISPTRSRGNGRFITVVNTNAGFELIISGQGTQKVAVHVEISDTQRVVSALVAHKNLSNFLFKTRTRTPGA